MSEAWKDDHRWLSIQISTPPYCSLGTNGPEYVRCPAAGTSTSLPRYSFDPESEVANNGFQDVMSVFGMRSLVTPRYQARVLRIHNNTVGHAVTTLWLSGNV